MRRDLATAHDEIKQLKTSNVNGISVNDKMVGMESEIKAQFEEKKNEFLREEKRKFEEFKVQVAAKKSQKAKPIMKTRT